MVYLSNTLVKKLYSRSEDEEVRDDFHIYGFLNLVEVMKKDKIDGEDQVE